MNNRKSRRLLIIVNPAAGQRSRKKFDHVVSALRRNNMVVDIRETRYPGHGRLVARKYVDHGYDMIVAAGGDGTINDVLNGIYPRQIPFGLIPLGTVNVLAREINLTSRMENIVDCLVKGHVRPCWPGISNGQYFFLMVSVGLDSLAVAHVNTALKAIIGRAAYVLSFIREVIRSRNITCQVTADGKTYPASNVIITNGRLYGGQYICAPEARMEDRLLYLVLAEKTGRLNALKYAFLMLRQKYPACGSVSIRPVTKAVIKCDIDQMPVQIDGDNGGGLPVEISLSDSPVNLVCPDRTRL